MLVTEQKENTVWLVGAIHTVLFSEYGYPFSGIDMIAPFGEKCKTFLRKCQYLCCKKGSQRLHFSIGGL